MSDLRFLVRSRGILRTQATKLNQKVEAEIESMSKISKRQNEAKAQQLISELKELDKEILKLKFVEEDERALDTEAESCEAYNQALLNTIAVIGDSMDSTATTDYTADQTRSGVDAHKLKLPEIPLPTYSHLKTESLTQFLRSFEHILSKYNLTEYTRFVYLKRQLKGEPLTLINSLDESRQCYEAAKELLCEAFASEITQKFDAIKRLSELKLVKGGDAYSYISEMRVIVDLFKNLSITEEVILQYFIWNGLDECMQSQLITICNDNKPSLEMINRNIFKALDRCTEVLEHKKIKEPRVIDASSNAVNVRYGGNVPQRKPLFCSLCSENLQNRETSHSTKDCRVYPTVDAKLKRLREINACTTCGLMNHKSVECKFVFSKKCFNCNGNHMTFLCAPVQKSNSSGSSADLSVRPKTSKFKSNKGKVVSNVVWTGAAMQSAIGGNSVLPTFTCFMNGYQVRGMKDSGCQPSFVESELAEKLDLPVVSEDIQIKISGFNSSKNYKTKIVMLEMYIGGEFVRLEAVVVPKIRINLNLPGLNEVVAGFRDKGYVLADRMLESSRLVILL